MTIKVSSETQDVVEAIGGGGCVACGSNASFAEEIILTPFCT